MKRDLQLALCRHPHLICVRDSVRLSAKNTKQLNLLQLQKKT